MPAVTMRELLESGVHFGHQTRRWNPRMKPYIFTERGGIYIIDLQKTIRLIDEAFDFVKGLTADGKMVLFVGTKKQCQDTIQEEATRVGVPYVSHRWLGGLLTNYATISNRIKRMHDLRRLRDEGQLDLLPTKEHMARLAELRKLEQNLGGVADMNKLPAAVFVIDPRREAIVIREARKLGIPVVALVDTNCNPDEVDYVIPGNDDAIRSCGLIIRAIAAGVMEGKQLFSEREMQAAMKAQQEAERAAAEKAAAAKAAAEKEAAEKPAAEKAPAKPGDGKKAAAAAEAPKAKAKAAKPKLEAAEPKAKAEPKDKGTAAKPKESAGTAKAKEKSAGGAAGGAMKTGGSTGAAAGKAEDEPAAAKPEPDAAGKTGADEAGKDTGK
ncbi:MAG: 30S ribosomal protein S2 [Actinobacteria bacterium]|nr:30S ribosomal protein S2 [Actinomycetota bacterium]